MEEKNQPQKEENRKIGAFLSNPVLPLVESSCCGRPVDDECEEEDVEEIDVDPCIG